MVSPRPLKSFLKINLATVDVPGGCLLVPITPVENVHSVVTFSKVISDRRLSSFRGRSWRSSSGSN